MPKGRPQASWLRQVEAYLKDAGMAGLASAWAMTRRRPMKETGMTGLASVWAMARRRPKEYRRKVDAATPCSGECPHT